MALYFCTLLLSLSVVFSAVDECDHLFCADQMSPAQESCDCGADFFLTEDDISDLRDELRDAFDTTISDLDDPEPVKPLLATTVRLAFHDCGGGVTVNGESETPPTSFEIPTVCDGCINLENPDHAGLAYARNALDAMYESSPYNWYNKMSRADFYMISATIAVEYGSELSDIQGTIEEIGYFCGRTDCFSSPTTNNLFPFPPALGCMQDLVDWFTPRFGFNEFDIVGLLGAHSLGMAHEDASGFEGPWVDGAHKDKLDNEFYVELTSQKWKQVEAPGNDGFQWTPRKYDPEVQGPLPLLMLNADMVLEREICAEGIDNETGQVSDAQCGKSNKQCPLSSLTAQDAMVEYQQSNQDWLDAFATVFRTMITIGSDTGGLCRVGTIDESDDSDASASSSDSGGDSAEINGEFKDSDGLIAQQNSAQTTRFVIFAVFSVVFMCIVIGCGGYYFCNARKSKVLYDSVNGVETVDDDKNGTQDIAQLDDSGEEQEITGDCDITQT